MDIQKMQTSKTFEASIKKTAQEMLDAGKKFQKLDAPFGSYVVSVDREHGAELHHIFTGTYLGIACDAVFVFKG